MTMRENMGLYRGKHNDTWIEGSLLIDEVGNCYIGTYLKSSKCDSFIAGGGRQCGKTAKRFLGVGFALVDPETVGQYAGLTDKNGKKIFEGDIVRDISVYTAHLTAFERGRETKENVERFRYYGKVSVVSFETEDHGSCGCCYHAFSGSGFEAKEVDIWCCEVIGNIHDTPELLEAGHV